MRRPGKRQNGAWPSAGSPLDDGRAPGQRSADNQEQNQVAPLHLALLHRGERYGLIGLRRFYAGYFRGMPGAARLRADFAGYKEAATVEDRLLSMGAVADPGLPALRVAGKAAAA